MKLFSTSSLLIPIKLKMITTIVKVKIVLWLFKETDDEDDFEDWGDDENENDEKYWFTKDKIDKISSVHNYLDDLPQVGKVLSFSSIIDVATMLNNNKPLGTLEMGVLYSKIPESIKTEIIDPYISIKDNEARINLRIIDSQENLRRNDLIKKINYCLLYTSPSPRDPE